MTEHPYESDADPVKRSSEPRCTHCGFVMVTYRSGGVCEECDYDRRIERKDKGEDYKPPRRQIGEWPGDPQDATDEEEGEDE